MRKLTLLVGFGAGYVLGAQAGRERYDQIVELATKARQRPEVQHAADTLQQRAGDLEDRAKEAVSDKVVDITAPLVAPISL